MRVVTYYGNRKLYDRNDSKYITLKEVIQLVRNGEQLQVISHKNRSDITSQILRTAISRLNIPTSECLKLIQSHDVLGDF
jgi:polyhydroxyalkanoate synthesis regulator protein